MVALGGEGVHVAVVFDLLTEVRFGFDPIVDFGQKFFGGRATVIACNRFVQVPPDAFDGIGVGSVLWEKVQLDAVAVASQVIPDGSAIMELCVVADHMNLPVASQAAAEVIQMCQEHRGVALTSGR